MINTCTFCTVYIIIIIHTHSAPDAPIFKIVSPMYSAELQSITVSLEPAEVSTKNDHAVQ